MIINLSKPCEVEFLGGAKFFGLKGKKEVFRFGPSPLITTLPPGAVFVPFRYFSDVYGKTIAIRGAVSNRVKMLYHYIHEMAIYEFVRHKHLLAKEILANNKTIYEMVSSKRQRSLEFAQTLDLIIGDHPDLYA